MDLAIHIHALSSNADGTLTMKDERYWSTGQFLSALSAVAGCEVTPAMLRRRVLEQKRVHNAKLARQRALVQRGGSPGSPSSGDDSPNQGEEDRQYDARLVMHRSLTALLRSAVDINTRHLTQFPSADFERAAAAFAAQHEAPPADMSQYLAQVATALQGQADMVQNVQQTLRTSSAALMALVNGGQTGDLLQPSASPPHELPCGGFNSIASDLALDDLALLMEIGEPSDDSGTQIDEDNEQDERNVRARVGPHPEEDDNNGSGNDSGGDWSEEMTTQLATEPTSVPQCEPIDEQSAAQCLKCSLNNLLAVTNGGILTGDQVRNALFRGLLSDHDVMTERANLPAGEFNLLCSAAGWSDSEALLLLLEKMKGLFEMFWFDLASRRLLAMPDVPEYRGLMVIGLNDGVDHYTVVRRLYAGHWCFIDPIVGNSQCFSTKQEAVRFIIGSFKVKQLFELKPSLTIQNVKVCRMWPFKFASRLALDHTTHVVQDEVAFTPEDVERMLEKRDIYIRQNSEITHRASVLDKLNMNSIKLLMRGANLLADTDGKLPVQIENAGQARAYFEEKLMELDTTQAS